MILSQRSQFTNRVLKYAVYLSVLWCITTTSTIVLFFSSPPPRGLSTAPATPHSSNDMHHGKLIIAATVRDVAPYLSKLKPIIVSATEHFEISGLVFFENDSKDGTVAKLRQWSNIAPVHILSSNSLQHTPRTTALALGRNTVWQTIARQLSTTDYVLWLDMDEVNFGLAHLDSCLDLPSSWSACCVNQYYLYYDLWALRHEDWMPCDWWNTCSAEFRSTTETMRAKHIPADHPPIRVDSCFGGAVLYKVEHVRGLDLQQYNGTAEKRVTDTKDGGSHVVSSEGCEHVPFHLSLREQNPNFTMFVQPSFLNSGPPLVAHKRSVVDAARPHWEDSFANPKLAQWYDPIRPRGTKKS